MKWRIVDIHEGDAHYHHRGGLIGTVVSDDVVTIIKSSFGDDWKLVDGGYDYITDMMGDTYKCFAGVKLEKVEDIPVKRWKIVDVHPNSMHKDKRNELLGMIISDDKIKIEGGIDSEKGWRYLNGCIVSGVNYMCAKVEPYEELTEEKAVELSIKKWEWLRDNPDKKTGDVMVAMPELSKYPWGCALCKIYNADHVICTIDKQCPLYEVDTSIDCCIPFDKWRRSDTSYDRAHWAEQLLNKLYKIRDDIEKEEFTFDKALKMTVEKWEETVKNNGMYQELECGLCKYHPGCLNCPLNDYNAACCMEYANWKNTTDDKLKWAVKLLNRIYDIKERYESGELKID